MSKIFNAFIDVVHCHTNTTFSFEFVDFHSLLLSLIICENNFKFSRFIDCKIGGSVLISESVSSNNNGFFPSWNKSWDVIDDDRFSEDGSVENVSDCTVGAFPHVFKVELFDSCLIRGDGGTFDTNFALFDGIGSINCDLIIGGISVFDTEVKVLDIEIKEWEDKLIFNGFPDDSGHLISIKFSNWVLDFDFFELHQK